MSLLAIVPGCGADLNSQDGASDASDASSLDGASSDAGSSCLLPGTGQVRVMLQLAPGLDVNPADLWVAAMCTIGTEEYAVRVVRADPSGGPTTLAGLGAGSYVIRAGALVAQGVASPLLVLGAGATTVTSLTLAPGTPRLAMIHTGPGGADAGLDASAPDASGIDASASDAIAPPHDAGPQTGITVGTRIVRMGGTDVLGLAEAMLQPHGSTSFDVTVRVTAADCTQSCSSIALSGAEIRSTSHGDPLGFAVTRFDFDTIAPGATATAERRTIAGSLDSLDLGIDIAVFGAPVDADGGAAPRDL